MFQGGKAAVAHCFADVIDGQQRRCSFPYRTPRNIVDVLYRGFIFTTIII